LIFFFFRKNLLFWPSMAILCTLLRSMGVHLFWNKSIKYWLQQSWLSIKICHILENPLPFQAIANGLLYIYIYIYMFFIRNKRLLILVAMDNKITTVISWSKNIDIQRHSWDNFRGYQGHSKTSNNLRESIPEVIVWIRFRYKDYSFSFPFLLEVK